MSAVDFRHHTTLVTGASSGIGEAFARALAARGSDLVLVARRLDRLQALADELERRHGVRAVAIAQDLGVPAAGRALAAATAERGLQVTSLVNNAGFGTDGPFHEEDPTRLGEQISVNVASLVDITHAFIAGLRADGTGVLVNVASMAAYNPVPGMATYAATKAFVLSFTEALWHESRPTGLRVVALSPGLTRTEFFDVLGGDAYAGSYQSPAEVVEAALRALDRGATRPSVTSGRRNAAVTSAVRLLTRRRAVIAAAAAGASASRRADAASRRAASSDA